MIEVVAITVNAIVAGNTIRPVGEEVCLGEGNVHFFVAVLAGVGCEGLNIIAMAIAAGKRFAPRLALVPLQ